MENGAIKELKKKKEKNDLLAVTKIKARKSLFACTFVSNGTVHPAQFWLQFM